MNDGARVLIVGAGGLGSPLALSLAADPAIATLTLIDADRVELSNLHRQILLCAADVDRPKVESAHASLRRRVARLQTSPIPLHIQPLALRFTPENSHALLAEHDLIIDGSDDLDTKFLVNDSARAAGKPALIGGIVRWNGQIQTVWPESSNGACYRCLFESPPPAGTAISCQQAGVLGPACGVVAGLMAAEALRILRGRPRFADAVLTLDLLQWTQRRIPLSRRADCPACAHAPQKFDRSDVAS